jgi:prepilin-type N-terminal cleavage/methylation domain-containing protein
MTRTVSDCQPHPRQGSRGFSMIELLIAVSVTVIMVAASVPQLMPVLQQWHANNAASQMLSQLRWARQSSIAERRNIQVQFLGNNELKLVRNEVPAGQTVLSDLFLTGSVQFMLTPQLPDTPDGFGNTSAIEFGGLGGGPVVMQFQSDGTFVDGNGNPINGSVFLGIPNYPSSARAITVLGATGRVHGFRTNGQGWIQ